MSSNHPRLTLVAACLATCVALPTRADERPASRAPQLFVVFIGGMDSDPTPEQIDGTAPPNTGNSGLYQLCGRMPRERVVAEYFNWNGTRAGFLKTPEPPGSPAIAAAIREHADHRPQDRIALVGNSWGGHTAFEAIRLLRAADAPLAVDLAIFLDASSTARGAPPQEFPENVNRLVQYRTRNAFVWKALPRERRVESIDLGDPAAGFMRNGRPAYGAAFDFQAHIAAEWDERIHDAIRERLLALVREG
jgi:hypothetical protein